MALLPSDQYLAHMLGLTEEQFEYFKEEVRRQNAAAPQPAVVAGIDPVTLSVITLVVMRRKLWTVRVFSFLIYLLARLQILEGPF